MPRRSSSSVRCARRPISHFSGPWKMRNRYYFALHPRGSIRATVGTPRNRGQGAAALEVLRLHAALHLDGLLAQPAHHLHAVLLLPIHADDFRRFLRKPPIDNRKCTRIAVQASAGSCADAVGRAFGTSCPAQAPVELRCRGAAGHGCSSRRGGSDDGSTCSRRAASACTSPACCKALQKQKSREGSKVRSPTVSSPSLSTSCLACSSDAARPRSFRGSCWAPGSCRPGPRGAGAEGEAREASEASYSLGFRPPWCSGSGTPPREAPGLAVLRGPTLKRNIRVQAGKVEVGSARRSHHRL